MDYGQEQIPRVISESARGCVCVCVYTCERVGVYTSVHEGYIWERWGIVGIGGYGKGWGMGVGTGLGGSAEGEGW